MVTSKDAVAIEPVRVSSSASPTKLHISDMLREYDQELNLSNCE